MTEEMDLRARRLKEKLNQPDSGNSRFGKALPTLKKIAKFVGYTAAVLTVPAFILTRDFLVKRQDYPERDVLFRSSNVNYIAGDTDAISAGKADRQSITQYYSGGGKESKVGTYLTETTRESRGDIYYFNMEDSQKLRIASATQKPERFQKGIRLSGSLNYVEEFAEIVLGKKSKAPQKYSVYKFVPERALQEVDVDVVEHEDGSREMVNRLVESRSPILGWLFGKEKFRAGTSIEDYVPGEKTKMQAEEFFKKVRAIDSPSAQGWAERESLFWELVDIEEKMEKRSIYTTFEDGILKIIPQGSTVYLGYRPNMTERMKNWAGFGRDEHVRLRIDTKWDLLPGRIPFLKNIHFGSAENQWYPFDKYNNGGYVLSDKFGKIWEIDIEDFFVFYGEDTVYSYFLDLNGDGKIDKKNELIGKVLCRTTHDEKIGLEKYIRQERPKSDKTFTVNYSFMAPDSDKEKGMKYFRLCAYMESMMPDQLHRGFGRHSLLGFINDQRSDLVLSDNLTIENMSRALTQESTLAAKYDIIRVLNAAQRPYAEELATAYGIHDNFEGEYGASPLLKKQFDAGPLPGIATTLLALGGLGYYIRRQMKQNEIKGAKKTA
jgi:hypothetical protein